MRILEITDVEQNPEQDQASNIPPVDTTQPPVTKPAVKKTTSPKKPEQPQPTVVKTVKKKATDGPYEFNNRVYANYQQSKELKTIIDGFIKEHFPNSNVRADNANPKVGELVPSVRILNALPKEEVKNLLIKSGYQLNPADTISGTVTGTFLADTYTVEINSTLYTIVLAGKGGTQQNGQAGAEVGIQQLRPDRLGLAGKTYNKSQLVEVVKKALVSVVGKDPVLLRALSELLDVAAGTLDRVDPTLMAHIAPSINLISQDFGEVLTPIKMADDDSLIEFPAKSNEALIDVKVKGQPVAVKSLGGSGNSFSVIQDMIDDYEQEAAKNSDTEQSRLFNLIKEFRKGNGSTKDNLIRVAQLAKIPESIALTKLLGSTPMSYDQMEQAVAKFVAKLKRGTTDDKELYGKYLNAILPVATAGKWMTNGKDPKVKALGMPSDWHYYTGIKNIEDQKNAKASGKKMFDANFNAAAASQLTYLLGWAFRMLVAEGNDSEHMGKLITNILTKKDATAAKIGINSDGTIKLDVIPFSSLRFGYQYHAGTSRPAQNAPGFHIFFD